MDFFSHIEENKEHRIISKTLLKDHLKEVAKRAKDYLFFCADGDVKEVAYWVGLTHDFGKFTTYFQDRLFKRKRWGKEGDHSFISALFASYVFSKKSKDFLIDIVFKEFLPLISFFVVYYHHGDLTNLADIKDKLESKDYEDVLEKQIDDLKSHKEEIEDELSSIGLDKTVGIDDFESDLENIKDLILKQIYYFQNKIGDIEKEKIVIFILALFSSLIDSDKKSAGKVQEMQRYNIPEDIVETYKKKKFSGSPQSGINIIREEIFNRVVKRVNTLDLDKKIYTLTAPTGSGKTLTAFSFAIKLRKKIENEFEYTPRIIYSLPFISIIKQNYEILKEVLSYIPDFNENSSSYIIEHHHLSDIAYKSGDEDKETEEALSLIESWESEAIVTTFIQFFYTIVGFKNNFLKKYHNISRSIIILDEVQNIPLEYYELVRNVLKLLAKYLNCYIILMTATKPLIFEEYEYKELLEDSEKYFNALERVKIYTKFNDVSTLEELKEYFLKEFDSHNSYMIVLNTISSSIAFYNYLKKQLSNCPLYYLSTNIIPKERSRRIVDINTQIKEGKKPILVSTQVVEAGVDLDFDTVLRDIAPLDSIVQVAGRCNREFKKDFGEVFIFDLKTEKGARYASYVYSKTAPYLSLKILSSFMNATNSKFIREPRFLDLVNSYFKEIERIRTQKGSEDIYKALLNMNFYDRAFPSDSVSGFELIRGEGSFYPIYIEIDDEAKEIWENYFAIVNDDSLDRWGKKKALLKIKSVFENHIVSVRLKSDDFATLGLAVSENLGYVPYNKLDVYYDNETGFKKKTGDFIAL